MINISHFYPRQVMLLIQSWWLLHVHTCKQYWWWKKKSLTKCFPAIQPLLNVPPYQCAKDQMHASGKYAEIFDSLKKVYTAILLILSTSKFLLSTKHFYSSNHSNTFNASHQSSYESQFKIGLVFKYLHRR